MSEPLEKVMYKMYSTLETTYEYGNSFRFKLPKKGLALRSVCIEDGEPKLFFEAADCIDSPTISEEDVAVIARLVSENKRPEFFYMGIPPGHPFHGRQYKLHPTRWVRGTSVGEMLDKVDYKMKMLSIGANSNEANTEFWEWSGTSKLEGQLGTTMDFPYDPTEGCSVKMSCKSVEVEKTDNDLVFVGEPKMQIISDGSPQYSKYITSIFDRVAYYDEPLFLKTKEIVKLVLAMEFFKERGVKFDREWMMEHTNIKRDPPTSQADELQEIEMPEIPGIPDQDKWRVQISDKEMKLSSKDDTSDDTVAVSIDNYDLLYDGADPKMPIALSKDGFIVPDVDSWNELYSETVPWPRVWDVRNNRVVRTAGGGVTMNRIPTTQVSTGSTGSSSKSSPTKFNRQGKTKGPYESTPNGLSVSSSTARTRQSSRSPPEDMIPKCEKRQAPSRIVGPKQPSSGAKAHLRGFYGYSDESSTQVFDKDGGKVFHQESMKFVKKQKGENGETEHLRMQLPLMMNGDGQAVLPYPPPSSDCGASEVSDMGVFSPVDDSGTDTPGRFLFCSPIGSDDEMD